MKTSQPPIDLKTVAIEMKGETNITPTTANDEVGNILINSRHSLTEVRLTNCAELHFLCGENITFPRVNTLSLTNCVATSAALANSFANVKRLTIFNSHFSDLNNPETSPTSRSAHPTLFPRISSLTGDEPDVTRFLQSNGQYYNCRRLVIDSQWDYPGRNVGDATPNFSVADAVPQLKSFHFFLWHVSPTELWWREFVESVPHLTFLNVSVRIQTADELELSVSNSTCANEQRLTCFVMI
jgi:hypothetical protein